MAIRNSLKELLNDFCCLEFGELNFVRDCIEKLLSLTEFGNEEVIDVIFEDFVNLHDVWMVELPENTQLGLKEFLFHRIHFRFFDNFYCPQLIDAFALACPDLAERTLSQYLSKLIAIFELGLVKSNEVSLLNYEFIFSLDFWFFCLLSIF